MENKITYKSSGVDIKKADVFVKSIQGLVRKTLSKDARQRHKAFGSLFSLDIKKYKNPILVSSTDGVGTKLMIANLVGTHDTVGIDLVAMNVNDILCAGAKPLFFLDYIACGRLSAPVLKDVISGIVEGCRQAGCSLIGGETAEMPGIYKRDDYDLAGFAVGVVEKSRILEGSRIKAGDCLIGLAASGLHSNGFSLVRKVFSLQEQKRLARELLTPTRIYVKPVLGLLQKFPIKGIAHITGGAFYEKLTKIIPQGKCCQINKGSWPIPDIFRLIQRKGRISDREMFTVFNMGIGMVLVADSKNASAILKLLSAGNLKAWKIGYIINDKKRKIIL